MDDVLLPLEDVEGDFSAVFLFVGLGEVELEGYFGLVLVEVELLDEIDQAEPIVEWQFGAKKQVFLIFTEDDVHFALLQPHRQFLQHHHYFKHMFTSLF